MLNWGGVLWNSVPLLTEDAMRYPIVIERGDDTHAYGVVVPDLPGCFSAGDTLDEAYVMAKEAVEGWLECAIDDGGERQKFCVHGIIGARQTGASNEHEHQTQFS